MKCRWCSETSVGYCYTHLQEKLQREESWKQALYLVAAILAGFGVVSKLLGMP